jgi:hypothetical protein
MSCEPADRSKSRVFKAILIGVALASVLMPPSAAQRKGNRSPGWGSMFKSQVEKCWIKPYGGDAAVNVEVAFTIKLTRDGLLMEPPVIDTPATSDFDKAYQKSAVKALNGCQPYKLPIEDYEEWKYFAPVFTERGGKTADGLFTTRSPSICRGC